MLKIKSTLNHENLSYLAAERQCLLEYALLDSIQVAANVFFAVSALVKGDSKKESPW